ncbi:hypothetical protein [Paraburkholderia sp.]|uniref:hypothetical protein n=1 Tax=Paraburkholderia sp. TaxID=1926495 RepID=UPI0025FEE0F7|nr:hypothetical protein [Paraburkholderia sp.]
MPRKRAIALIVGARNDLLSHAAERIPADAQPLNETAAQLERLLLDVRAGRINEFELHHPAHIHVWISAD